MRPLGSLVVTALVVALGPPAIENLFARDLTLDERVRAQAAVERVYYEHRIGVTRTFEELFPREVLERRVRNVLARSAALDRYWNTPITAAMLREEASRIERQTRLPERLLEIQAALGGDDFLFQEIVARATLSDRLIRSFYAQDAVLHAGARSEAEALRSMLSSGALSPYDDERHRSVHVARREAAEGSSDPLTRSDGSIGLAPDAFRRLREASPSRRGEIGYVGESPDGFSFSALLDEGPDRIRLATYVVAKRSFDAWWAGVDASLQAVPVAATAEPGGPRPAMAAACAVDTWEPGALSQLPDGRMQATAVWTGTEMIVWGGTDYIGSSQMNSGGRYDPLTDSWSATSMLNAPGGRVSHTAVWTGDRMIVWGGSSDFPGLISGTGGRYDPISDTWTPTSVVGAPLARQYHVAVWTGSRMVIWGGFAVGDGVPGQTGGMYNPGADSWIPTSLAGAPAGRNYSTAVWSGSRMMIWGGGFGIINGSGGFTYTFFNSGALFNPANNTWQAMPTLNAPTPRWLHTAVWTGTKMLVWGGENYAIPGGLPADGGRYDAGAGAWSPMSTSGQPSPRTKHTAVWAGDKMIVWGGGVWSTSPGTGGRYDPSSDTWTATGLTGAPQSRWQHVAVWTGSRMIVWGGVGPSAINHAIALNNGARYDPASDTWTPTSMGTVPAGRSGHSAVWTGIELIVWGGAVPAPDGFDTTTITGGRYDPALDQWTPTTTVGAPSTRQLFSAVWSGQSMIVWGGSGFTTGGRYDPLTDTWQATSINGAPSARRSHVAFWTGKRMLIWGGIGSGESLPGDGGLYDPVTDIWSPIPGIASKRGPAATWTGSEMLIWGGRNVLGNYTNIGFRYNPTSNSWQWMSTTNAPSGREGASGVWTGREMIVWGGVSGTVTFPITGGRYDLATDSWAAIATTGAPVGRSGHPAAWTGEEMVVWGGGGSGWDNSGGRYDPASDSWLPTSTATAPIPRQNHTATWTPLQLLVWGGATRFEYLSSGSRYCACDGSTTTVYQDADGDGHGDGSMPIYACSPPPGSAPAGDDCADGDANAWSVPSEVPQLDFADQTGLAWLPPVNAGATAVSYDLLRSSDPGDFVTNATCLPVDPGGLTAADPETPAVGGFFFYLARARNGCPGAVGSLGHGSDGEPRAGRSCP